MELLTLSLQGFDEERGVQLRERLKLAIDRLHKEGSVPTVIWNAHSRELCIRSGKFFSLQKDAPRLFEAFGQVMARFMTEVLERDLIRDRIEKTYRSLTDTDKTKLVSYSLNILQETDWEAGQKGRERQEKSMASAFRHYVENHTYLHLGGYLRFRMKEYVEDLQTVVEYAAEEMMIDRQYHEFISLLKYFVFAQEIKIPAVHLYHRRGSDFVVLDEKYRPIDTNKMDGLVVETMDKELNLEDMIISTLITVCPETVYIHTDEPDMQVIRTICQIFEERAVLCT